MIIFPGSLIYDNEREAYEVLEPLGSGGFGYVYLVARKSDGNLFALKTLPANFDDERIFKSFVNEASLAIKVKHLNVIEYKFFHDGSAFNNLPPYILMEFAEGGTLKKIIDIQKSRRELFDIEELKRYYLDLIDGIEAINSVLVHRDIKPDNILIKDNLLKISDFGLSKVVEQKTRTSTFKGIGHIMYMCPEGWKYEANTIQMDIYSMGIVFYELATLKHPFEYLNLKDAEGWRNAHLSESPESFVTLNSNLSTAIQQMISKMIEKSITLRFKDWSQVREALNKANLPKTEDTDLVENLLRKRLEQDTKKKEERFKIEKRAREIEEHNKLVQYQFRKAIFEPIKQFIEELNKNYEGDKIDMSWSLMAISMKIMFTSSKWIEIQFRSLKDEDFYKKVAYGDYGREVMRKELDPPKFGDKKIMGWGFIKSFEGFGYNLILVERDSDLYGDWYIMITTNYPLSRERRLPEPFPLDFSEMGERIKHLNVIDIYQTEIKLFETDFLKEFIGHYFVVT